MEKANSLIRDINRFIELRKNVITKKELAKKMGMTESGFHRTIEEGKMKLGIYLKMCEYLKIDPYYLISGKFQQEDYPIHPKGSWQYISGGVISDVKTYELLREQYQIQIDRLVEEVHHLMEVNERISRIDSLKSDKKI